jgi:DNA-binding MarR family transcriptional regulator/N-acetylglutamate synthase-like GNAT family acetyltransferase
MTELSLDRRIQTVRRFNRFYTRQIGVLQEGFLGSPLSLTEVRVLYELAHRQALTATDIGNDLGLDAGYLSRILAGFESGRLVKKTPSEADGRQSILALTSKGRAVFGKLNAISHHRVASMLTHLSGIDQQRLIESMNAIEKLLGAPPENGKAEKSPYLLRPHQPGDMGWVVHRHGVLYAHEYGYDEDFEALVAEIVAKFIQYLDPKRERCWMAEKEGEIVGSVFLVKKSETVAKLRLLLVEPSARGMGIGARLIGECVRFARQTGYRKITLWTQSELKAARHLYKQAGFSLVEKKKHHSFGHDLVAETWALDL